ncbi:MAG: hypothetical protein ACRC14_08540, partial [Paracoccaceae bacterium]
FYGSIAGPTQYIMEWTGEGEINISDPYTVIGENKILVDFVPDYIDDDGKAQQDGLTIILTDTDPNDTGNYIRDIKVYRAEDADLLEAGERFNPDWFDRVDDFRILRTHDWQSTNFPSSVDWTLKTETADQATWGAEGRGMPYELMVQMANETRSDLWLNIPHTASDQYIREAAEYVKANLDPDLRVMAEFSNEFWTSIFNQYQYFIDGGAEAFGAAKFSAAQFYGTRAADMAEIFTDVFGADNPRLRPTLTVDDVMFASGEARAVLEAPAHVRQGGDAPWKQGFEVIATDGYLSWYGPDEDTGNMIRGWMTEPDGGFGSARDFLLNQLYTQLLPNWQKGRALADKYGLEFMVYEGGALLLNQAPGADPAITDFAIRFSKSEELKEVYEAEMAAWATVGSGPFAWYADVGRPGPWGDYGHWKGIDFVPDPRTEVITDANETLPPWWTGDDTRPASTWDNGKYDAGEVGADVMAGTGLVDRLYGLAGNDKLTGLQGADRLWGGLGQDILHGGLGADELTGGAGRDLADYAGSAAGVQVSLAAGIGRGGDAEGDRLASIESLRGSAFADRLVGDDGANFLLGGAGADFLTGGLGADLMAGGAGADRFVYREAAEGGDTIMDFNRNGDDVIRLKASAFGDHAVGALAESEFQAGVGNVALSGSVRVMFDTSTGQVWFDADGAGGQAAVLLVQMQAQAVVGVEDFLFF